MFDSHLNLLTRLVSATDQRHQVISHNIANVNTPNYRRLELDFEAQLANEIRRETGSSSSPAEPVVRHTPGLQTRSDGNNVDIDREIGHLNKNAMLQQMYLQLLSTEMSQLRRAMEGG